MSIAILASMGLAALVGLSIGFRRWWHESMIVGCLVVPLLASGVFAVTLGTPSYLDKLGWLLITFFYSFLCASLAWGTAAGMHFGATWVYRNLTLVRAAAQKAAGRST
jgi:hypothetical protein